MVSLGNDIFLMSLPYACLRSTYREDTLEIKIATPWLSQPQISSEGYNKRATIYCWEENITTFSDTNGLLLGGCWMPERSYQGAVHMDIKISGT